MPRGPKIAVAAIDWRKAWRIIASRYPPIDLFERVTPDPSVWDVLIELEQATNPRWRDEIGEIKLVPPDRRVRGPNASWVMAPFTHCNPKGSRFSDGSWGVYYAANRFETAIAETVFHFERFAADSSDPPRREDMRVLVGAIRNVFHDADTLSKARRKAVLDPNSYEESRPLARALREADSNGIVHPSARDRDGRCVAAFWPNVVGVPIQERHLVYDWNGEKVVRYFDYKRDAWIGVGQVSTIAQR